MKLTPTQQRALVNSIERNLNTLREALTDTTLKQTTFKTSPLGKAKAAYDKEVKKAEEARKKLVKVSNAYLNEVRKITGNKLTGASEHEFKNVVVPAYAGLKPYNRSRIEDEVALLSMRDVANVDEIVAAITAKFLPDED